MQHLLITWILFISLTAFGQNQEIHQLDTEKSTIKWKGTYAFQFSEHQGTVQFQDGRLIVVADAIIGGDFIIDMTTISNEDYLQGIGPVEHLRNADFFNVPKFPQAQLVITSVEYFPNENIHKILADLTIKGITKPIEFWATADGVKKTLETKFKIDRTQWGITHNNKLKNHSISDAIEFYVTLQF